MFEGHFRVNPIGKDDEFSCFSPWKFCIQNFSELFTNFYPISLIFVTKMKKYPRLPDNFLQQKRVKNAKKGLFLEIYDFLGHMSVYRLMVFGHFSDPSVQKGPKKTIFHQFSGPPERLWRSQKSSSVWIPDTFGPKKWVKLWYLDENFEIFFTLLTPIPVVFLISRFFPFSTFFVPSPQNQVPWKLSPQQVPKKSFFRKSTKSFGPLVPQSAHFP